MRKRGGSPEHLYVARGSKGLLKVGRTSNLAKRYKELCIDFRSMGEELVRFESTEAVRYPSPEYRLIKSVRNQGLERVKGHEWFKGGDFDGIVQVAHKIQFEAAQEQLAATIRLTRKTR